MRLYAENENEKSLYFQSYILFFDFGCVLLVGTFYTFKLKKKNFYFYYKRLCIIVNIYYSFLFLIDLYQKNKMYGVQ